MNNIFYYNTISIYASSLGLSGSGKCRGQGGRSHNADSVIDYLIFTCVGKWITELS
eukprot:Pgem_evm1s13154